MADQTVTEHPPQGMSPDIPKGVMEAGGSDRQTEEVDEVELQPSKHVTGPVSPRTPGVNGCARCLGYSVSLQESLIFSDVTQWFVKGPFRSMEFFFQKISMILYVKSFPL